MKITSQTIGSESANMTDERIVEMLKLLTRFVEACDSEHADFELKNVYAAVKKYLAKEGA